MTELDRAKATIRELLREFIAGDIPVAGVSDTAPLRETGLSSTALVGLLTVMEDAFGFEWDDDVEPEVFKSIESLATYVVAGARVRW